MWQSSLRSLIKERTEIRNDQRVEKTKEKNVRFRDAITIDFPFLSGTCQGQTSEVNIPELFQKNL